MDTLTILLTALTIASILGAASAVFYGVRQKTIIEVLTLSNQSYRERNEQLEDIVKQQASDHAAAISELQGRVAALEKIKTPPLRPLMEQIAVNHKEVMQALGGKK